jgi:hypothetical protein
VTAAAEIGYSSRGPGLARGTSPSLPEEFLLPMYDTLSETQGCDLLARLFTKRGYAIKRNLQFREYGVEFHIDGWDPQARVGFEFLTSEDEDHDDLTLDEYKELSAAQRRGELAVFIIDEVEPLSAEDLAAEAHEFLDEVADAAHARLTAKARGKKVAKKPAVKKGVAKKKPAQAAAAKKPTAAKAAGRQVTARMAKKVVKKKLKKKVIKKVVKKATKKGGRR